MNLTSGSRLSRFHIWRNSIHLYLIAPPLMLMAAMTAFSLVVLHIADLPTEGRPISIYEMARLLRGAPLAGPPGTIVTRRQVEPPEAGASQLERLLAKQLAERTGRSESDVRLTLADHSPQRFAQVQEQVRLYSPDGGANPVVFGTFSIAERDGTSWLVIERLTPGTGWRANLWYSLAFGLLLTLPLTFWFSGRLARPIKALAASAQRMRGDQIVAPIDLIGPNEIQLAAEALNDMQARIARYVRERTTLTGAIAHDLRSPLSRIHFRLASAPSELRTAIEEDVREMERMLEMTLDFVENEIRPLICEPIDLAMLVEGVVEDFSDVGRDARVVATEPATIVGDPMLLRRAFSNLVENALKYGHWARVEVSRQGQNAKITVSDSGKGMAEGELARAFEPFYRGEPSRNHKTGGVGLGLSIVKSTADAHGGLVELANGPGGGLIVTVFLPLESES